MKVVHYVITGRDELGRGGKGDGGGGEGNRRYRGIGRGRRVLEGGSDVVQGWIVLGAWWRNEGKRKKWGTKGRQRK